MNSNSDKLKEIKVVENSILAIIEEIIISLFNCCYKFIIISVRIFLN